MIASDLELLEQYARDGSEEAFATVVTRHLDLVYSAALRQVRSSQLAEDVAQSVFTDLSRLAPNLKPDTVLSAWLYQVTRRTAVDVVRREARRQSREQIACEIVAMNSSPSEWTKVEPLLDEAMEALDQADRTAVLLRYFENKSLREVGQSLGASEDAAQKRVQRAVAQMRQFFSRRGVAVSIPSLVLLLSTNAVQSAPIGLGAAISAATTTAGLALHTVATLEITKAIAMTTLQKTLIATALAAAVGTSLYEAAQTSRLRDQVQAVERQQAPLAEDLQHARQQLETANSLLAAAQQESDSLRRDAADLPRLRGELARLRGEARESTHATAAVSPADSDPSLEAAFKTWALRAKLLRERLEQSPEKRIPEFQFLTDQNWFDAVKNVDKLETDTDYRQALNNLRSNAKGQFIHNMQQALQAYTKATGGELPTDFSQLQPYLKTPVDPSVFQRYTLLQSGKLSELSHGEFLVAETAPPVDDEYDTVYKFSLNGTSSSSVNHFEDSIKAAGIKFAEEHDGLLPTDPSQLAPYLKQPADPTRVQQMLAKIPPGITTLAQLKAAGILE